MKQIGNKNIHFSVIVVLIILASCGTNPVDKSQEITATASPKTTTANQSNKVTGAKTEQVKFNSDNGSEAFSLKPESNGAKFVDGKGKELAHLTINKNQKVKIKDAADKVLGYVVKKEGYWKVEDANQSKELYVLRRQRDGDYKLEDGTNNEIYRIKTRASGLEIESPAKKSLYKVKVKEGKTSLKNDLDKTLFSTKSNFLPIAVACFGFDKLSREQQAALSYAVNVSGGQ